MTFEEKFKQHEGHKILGGPISIWCSDCREEIMSLATPPDDQKFERIYLCSALRAPTPEGIELNILRARAAEAALRMKYDCRVVAPHAYLPYLFDEDVPEERGMALSIGLQLLDQCDALAICSQPLSEGMIGEILRAEKNGAWIITEYPHIASPQALLGCVEARHQE